MRIEIDEIERIDLCFNNLRISGYKKGLFRKRKFVSVEIGRAGVLTNIVGKDCKFVYPRDKFFQSNAVKMIDIGKEMN